MPGKELDSEQATLSVSEAKDQDADKSQSPVDLAPHRTGLATPTPVILDEEPENAATQQDRDTGDQRDESLVTDSSGHQDAAPSAEQLAERAVQLVAAREGVSTSYLEVIDSTRPSSPSEDYLTVLAGQRQWIATTNFAGCPGRPQIALRIAPCSLPRQSS